jgi:peptidylamidoglycolate lyase
MSMTQPNLSPISRRYLLSQTTVALAAAASMLSGNHALGSQITASSVCGKDADGEILGQGNFRYRAHRFWGRLDRHKYPVKDCHGIKEDRLGRIMMLTNDTHNNLIAYSETGEFIAAWETRFPAAHGLAITDTRGEDRFWITDHDRQVVSMCTPDGKELRQTGPQALASRYTDLSKYHPTNTAILPDGDFFVSDGYGSSFIHHFDPEGRYVSSLGGEGDEPSNLKEPHAVWVDTRSGKPRLLVCGRRHAQLKWFSLAGELLRVVPVPGALPSNVARFSGRYSDHLAIASLNGMILILDGADRVVSVVGGEPSVYMDGKLQELSPFNYTFNHPHDVHVDSAGALYVVKWWSNQTYPIKLEPLGRAGS